MERFKTSKGIQQVILDLERNRLEQKKLNNKINKYFLPKLKKAADEKNILLFSRILDECPDCYTKHYFYQLGIETEMLK